MLSLKWKASLIVAVLFLIVSHPATYNLTNSILGAQVGPLAFGGCPTKKGLIVHAIVFLLLARASMEIKIR